MGQKLGQHFLKNKKILRVIAEKVELRAGEIIIEIGPGHGELTEYFKSQISNPPTERAGLKNCKMILIEKDKALAEHLEKKFKKDKNIKIICGDALKELPQIVSSLTPNPHSRNPNYIIVGNIPYYITGYLFRTIQELQKRPIRTIVMIQKEVAERIVKKPPHMNLLAASIQYWADPKIIMSVPKREFSPQPKINSAVIGIYTKKTHLKNNGKKEEQYYNALTVLFKQPRKTIKNNITLFYRSVKKCNIQEKEALLKRLERGKINTELRPHNLDVEKIKKITNILCSR